jgi:hypothetical protein
MRYLYVISLLVAFFVSIPSFTPSATTSSCVVCHTDGEKMKTLVIPPKIHVEGAG